MNVEKEQSGNGEKVYYTGVSPVSVLMFSPTREQLNKLLNFEPTEEQNELDYIKEDVEVKTKDAEGNEVSLYANQVYVDVWVEEVKFKKKHKIRFTITNTPRVSQSGKTQYINQIGQTTWVDDESNLPQWFTHFKLTDKNDKSNVTYVNKTFRKCLMGEDNLYEFLVNWLDFNPFKETNDVFLDNKKLFKGDFSQLNSLVPEFEDKTIACAFGVRTKTDENSGEDKKYQSISPKFFFKGKNMKAYRNNLATNFEHLEADKGKGIYDLKQFIKNVSDSEYGIQDYFINREIDIYDPTVDPVNSEKAVISDTDSSY